MKAVWNLKNIFKKKNTAHFFNTFNLLKYEAWVFVKALTYFHLFKGYYATPIFSKLTGLEGFCFLSVDQGHIKTGLETLIRPSFIFNNSVFQMPVIHLIVL